MTQNDFINKYKDKIDKTLIDNIIDDMSSIISSSLIILLTDLFLSFHVVKNIKTLLKFSIIMSIVLFVSVMFVYFNTMLDYHIVLASFFGYICAQIYILYKIFVKANRLTNYISITYDASYNSLMEKDDE